MSDINNRDDQGREDLEDLNTDENIAGATHLDISAREEEVERLKDDLQEQKDKYLRLFAEFDNFRKRSARENLELRQQAKLKHLAAVRDGRFTIVPSADLVPGPAAVKALQLIARAAHPDAFR